MSPLRGSMIVPLKVCFFAAFPGLTPWALALFRPYGAPRLFVEVVLVLLTQGLPAFAKPAARQAPWALALFRPYGACYP